MNMDNDPCPSISSSLPVFPLKVSPDNLDLSWIPSVHLPKPDAALPPTNKSTTTYIKPRDPTRLNSVPGKSKVFRCTQCDYTCRFPNGLDYHKKKHHGAGEQFTCSVCGYVCCLKQNLTQHMRQHTGEKPYTCEFCDYRSASKSGLRYHVRTRHDKESLISCSVCGYKAYNTYVLTQHLRKHSGLKPFNCSICGTSYGIKTSLKYHMKQKHPEVESFES